MTDLVSISEMAEKLGVTRQKVVLTLKKLDIKSFTKLGGTRYYTAFDMEVVDAIVNPKCPYCNRKLNYLGLGEQYCKHCDKWFLDGREIFYTKNGGIIFAARRKKHENIDGIL